MSTLVWTCLLDLASACLRDLIYLTLDIRGCSFLRSMKRGVLFVPFARTSARQTRAFSVIGSSIIWNGLPLALRLLPRVHLDTFYSSLKTALFSRARAGSASE